MIYFKRMLRRSFKFHLLVYYLAFAMALISSVPRVGQAGTVPTDKSAQTGQFDRATNMAQILQAYNTQNGQLALKRAGMSADQFQAYLNRLNDSQLNLVAGKLRASAIPGGDGEGIFWALISLLIILFIIFLILDLTGIYKFPLRR